MVDKLMERSEFFSEYLVQVAGGANSNNNLYKMVAETIPTNEVKTNMDIDDIKQAASAVVETPTATIEEVKEKATTEAAEVTTPENYVGTEVELQATIDSLTANLQAKEDLLVQLTERAENAEKALADFQHDTKLKARTEKLSSVLPEDKVQANLKFAEKLSDDDFTSYMETLEGIYAASKASIAEIGVKAEDDTPAESMDAILDAVQKVNKNRT